MAEAAAARQAMRERDIEVIEAQGGERRAERTPRQVSRMGKEAAAEAARGACSRAGPRRRGVALEARPHAEDSKDLKLAQAPSSRRRPSTKSWRVEMLSVCRRECGCVCVGPSELCDQLVCSCSERVEPFRQRSFQLDQRPPVPTKKVTPDSQST